MQHNPDMPAARLALGLACLVGTQALETLRAAAVEPGLPRLVIAHHMNAEPPTSAGGQCVFGFNTPTPPRVRPGSSWAQVGGRVRDRAIGNLYDAADRPLAEQAAWDIAVAQRAGVDAFAFYGGVPGGEGRVLAYMRAAKGTGFKITFCPGGGERGETHIASLRRLIEADRDLDALLRVDGKLLLLTYGGNWGDNVGEMVAKRREIEEQIGTPMLVMYMPHPPTAQGTALDRPERWPEVYAAERERLGALFRGGFDGLSPFMVIASDRAEADARFWADVCRENGKLYFHPINFQFHSPLHMTHAPVADANWRRAWDVAHDGAAGVQVMTWNDWGETSALAPGVGANYGLYDLLREEAAAFKAGTPLPITEDQAWALYYRYPSDAESRLYQPPSPRKFRGPEHDHIWVLTSLTAPATVICAQGRGARDAPAGRSMVSFPLTPGPVRFSVRRGDREVLTLSPREEVTDQPWRPDHSLVAFASDEKEKAYREADFPGQNPRYGSEYGDDDGDGLLNWFEGLFFSSLDHPATPVGPDDNFNGIPLARAQREFLDPVMPPPHYPLGFVWGTRTLPRISGTSTPDENGVPVWAFGYPLADDGDLLPPHRAHQLGGESFWMWVRGHAQHRLRADGSLVLQPGCATAEPVGAALVWTSPVAGRMRVKAGFQGDSPAASGLAVRVMGSSPAVKDWRATLQGQDPVSHERVLDVAPGDRLRFLCRADPPRRAPPGVRLDLSIERIDSHVAIPSGDAVDPPVRVDLARWDKNVASALYAGRYRWGEAGLRREADGLAIFNPKDHSTREMFAFVDTVPNATYGPLCRWGDVSVTADIRFAYGHQPPGAWGRPAFAVTTRIAPQRRTLYFLRIEVPSRQEDPANPVATLQLGWMLRGGSGEPPREEVFAEASIPVPENGSFRLVLASQTGGLVDANGDEKSGRFGLDRNPLSSTDSSDPDRPVRPASAPHPDDTVRLTGVAEWPDGSQRRVLTGKRTMSKDGTSPWGEVGFSARLHEFQDTPEKPHHILLRAFAIGDSHELHP